MKKFKKSIEISPDNIWEVLNCPIVKGIQKETTPINSEGDEKPYATHFMFLLETCGCGLYFGNDYNQGNVLALDVCGTWYAFTKEEWDKHKNDEI